MAMMIAKFHRLIQSRLLWIVFLVVIVFAFVFWGTQLPDQTPDREERAPGFLSGEPVPAEEFHTAYRHEFVGLVLMFGPSFRPNDEIEGYLQDAAWRRLIGWREADRLGIRVSDAEVLRAIRDETAFQQNGVFSLDQYRDFLNATIGQMGLTERYFEEYLRGELRTRKLASMLEMVTLVSPSEISDAEKGNRVMLKAEYFPIPPDAVEDKVSVTETDALRVYERDPSVYRVPPRVRLRFVRFDAQRHLADIGAFSEEAIEDYYAVHARLFRRFEPGVDEEGRPTEPRSVLPPLDDVRDDVADRMRREAARARARSEADRFIRRIAPYASSRPLPFEEAAAEAGIEVFSAPPVSRSERIPGTDAPPAATEAAFALQPTAEEYFTEPFSGREAVFVFALDERLPAFIPDFESVREQALEDARAEKVIDAQRSLAEHVQRRLQTHESADLMAADLGLEVRTLEPFSVADGPGDPQARPLHRFLAGLNEQEVTVPVEAPGQILLVARLMERRPPTPEEMEIRPGIDPDSWRDQKAALVFHTWLQGLLERDRFEKRTDPSREIDDDYPEA